MAVKHPPAFLGRAGERAVLDRLLETVRDGRSAVLVMRGEAGIGKTALVRYAARQALGFRVAQIAGVEAEMELPFAGLHRLCAPMLPLLDALPDPQQNALRVAFGLSSGDAPDRFLAALAALTLLAEVAEERPLLCLVDDAHWLDATTLQILGFIARRLLAESVALVITVREESDERELADLPELSLGGLDDDDARALLAGVIPGALDDRVRDRLLAETRGNPLAIVELSRGRRAGELAGGFVLPGAGTLPSRIEDHYRQRIAALPEATQRLIVLAAADPVGDATLLWRAAATLGVERQAAEPAAGEQLLEIGAQVRFRHPLVRSAAYRAASVTDRRAVHSALAAATDPETDPDRRAWHRAHATIAPDEEVARELIESASRAQGRGGIAAAAAFLERAVTFTPDPGERASRALTAAEAKLEAGDLSAAGSLLAAADAGPLDELGQVRAQRVHAQIASDARRGSDAPPLLLRTAQRLEPLDAELARETHLKALVAVIYAGRLATGTALADVARAALSAPIGPEPLPGRQLLLLGLATRLTDGYGAAAPRLTAALRAHRAEERHSDWSWVAYSLAAMELWDDDAWLELASSQVELTRATGALILLPFALDYLATFHIEAGNLSLASALIEEAQSLDLPARAETLPYVPLRLAAWRGDVSTALSLVDVMIGGARTRGGDARSRSPITRRRSFTTGLVSTSLPSRPPRRRPRWTRSLRHRGRCPNSSRRLRGAGGETSRVNPSISCASARAPAARPWRRERRLARARSSQTVNRPSRCTERRSRRSGNLGSRPTLLVPGSATASGCAARTGASTRASSSIRHMTSSRRWARLDSPTGRDANCWQWREGPQAPR